MRAVGDRILIRRDLYEDMQVPFGVTSEMESYAGKECIITSVEMSEYFDIRSDTWKDVVKYYIELAYDECDCDKDRISSFMWCDAMFEDIPQVSYEESDLCDLWVLLS